MNTIYVQSVFAISKLDTDLTIVPPTHNYIVKFVTNPTAPKLNDLSYGESIHFRVMSYYVMSSRDPRNRSNKETCVDREAIMSQFRVWPFLSTIIMTFGERNRNPGHPFKPILSTFYLNNDSQYSVNFSLIKSQVGSSIGAFILCTRS